MEIGLRALALIVDVAFCFGSLPAIMMGTGWLVGKAGVFTIVLLPFWIVLFFVWPILYFSILTGLWDRTLGKLIFRLRVTDSLGRSPGIWRGMARETLKFLALCTMIGAMLTLLQVIYQGGTWYDNLCGTTVDFKPRIHLTKTQKNFRKHYKGRK